MGCIIGDGITFDDVLLVPSVLRWFRIRLICQHI